MKLGTILECSLYGGRQEDKNDILFLAHNDNGMVERQA